MLGHDLRGPLSAIVMGSILLEKKATDDVTRRSAARTLASAKLMSHMIADMLEDILTERGYDVCGIARTVNEGVSLCRLHQPDLAILDLRLDDDGLSTEIVAQLGSSRPRGVLYATGNMSQVILTTVDGDACISKPYSTGDLLRSLEIVAEITANKRAFAPFPRGLQILTRQASPAVSLSR